MSKGSQFPGPIGLAEEVADRYRRYLKTSFHFKDPELRRAFDEALKAEADLVKGPFLEAPPLYQRRRQTREVMEELLSPDAESAFVNSLDPRRRLYTHQEEAIRSVHRGRNVVVATSTGSGKTVAYLYPILLQLYKDRGMRGVSGGGVRALVLYPMNALAEDQRRRLGDLKKRFSENGSAFSFTFGRYTGETPEDENDHWRNAQMHRENALPGELVFRTQMRAEPPDILLTNYSMLEYLLLRPKDSDLFDNGRGATWRFLVLDEAHQYRGAKGLEMGMLLRRLKDRLRRGGLEADLRCIATSASLGGPEDRLCLSQFASELFRAPFEPDDIILGEKADSPEVGEKRLSPHVYMDLWRAIEQNEKGRLRSLLLDAAQEVGVRSVEGLDEEGILYRVLSRDLRVAEVRQRIEAPIPASSLADEIFKEVPSTKDRRKAIENLVALLVWARDPESATEPSERSPLVNVRYHLFLRALEGTFVSLHPQRTVRLSRAASTTDGGQEAAFFEVALCRECGQHYLVGRREEGKLKEAIRDWGDKDHKVSFFREVGAEELAGVEERKYSRLCLQCGAISLHASTHPGSLGCGHAHVISVVEDVARDAAEDQLRKCGVCEYRGPDPVREVVHGADGPGAVIATALIAGLPEETRKVLAFSDGRQEAAFFPCYLDETYRSVRDRHLLLVAARELANRGTVKEFSLGDLAVEVDTELRKRKIMEESKSDLDVRREAWEILFRELLSEQHRLSLEGVGLVAWYPILPEDLEIPPCLFEPPWSLVEEGARNLVVALVDSIRHDFAVELVAERQVSVGWANLDLHPPQNRIGIGDLATRQLPERQNFKAWDGKRGRRVSFLSRLLQRCSGRKLDDGSVVRESQKLLREVWDVLRAAGGDQGLLQRCEGDAFRARSVWWRLRVLGSADLVLQCETCERLGHRSSGDVCERYCCPGTLREVRAGDEKLSANHYRRLYEEENLPPHLRAEEHTAQLDPEKAREFQREFVEGKIHLLSSSTTFELGVDLDDLDTIFLRNVPPEPFNYAQRVGRAGRRAGHPGFAVTFCRRRPHDLGHFKDPSRMMAGKTTPPRLRWTNDKIALRHVAAVVLSSFFRKNAARFEKVEAFCGGLASPTIRDDIARFIESNTEDLARALNDIVPDELKTKVGLHDGSWATKLTGQDAPLGRAVAEVSQDWRAVVNLEESMRQERNYRAADWAKDRASTIAGDDVISFLSRKVVIPKYGFPVDVVELDLHRRRWKGADSAAAFGVTLERDLAIAVGEFAPGSEVVANKKLWTSAGLKRVAEKEWPRRKYLSCDVHGFRSWDSAQAPAERCCDKAGEHAYIDPIFGFVAERKPKDPKFRPERQYTTRPYFVRAEREDQPSDEVNLGGIARIWKASPGRLVVLCQGRRGGGFDICEKCGAGWSKRPIKKPHYTPLGQSCSAIPRPVALGHEFLTDVLRVEFTLDLVRPAGRDPKWFAYGLAYALYHGAAEVLEVPATDLNVTVWQAHGIGPLPEIVLYDSVPGGAGLVAELEDPKRFRAALGEALERVNGGCGCAAETSCYGCLRSYANQFAHAHLARGPIAEYLDRVLQAWQV